MLFSDKRYSLGLDYGTGSVRAALVDVADGRMVAEAIHGFSHGTDGVISSPSDTNLARQHPVDYLEGARVAVREALSGVADISGFAKEQVIGIGVDTTGSSPLPVDELGRPLVFNTKFEDDLDALVWLWKDHTSHAEAKAITEVAQKYYPHYLAKIGGTYSSEWFWAKIWHCAQTNSRVYEAAYTWVEFSDWLPAVITATTNPHQLKRNICAAGHKALYHREWGGYPEPDFLQILDPQLLKVRETLPSETYAIDNIAGYLSDEWAAEFGLPPGIPVAMGAIDAHMGAIGAGIQNTTLVKNIGTSCCDMLTAPAGEQFPDIPGLCGMVPGSILPHCLGLEAGQSAVGDIFHWLAHFLAGGEGAAARRTSELLAELESEAEKLRPGASGLLALDWLNGNRSILVDQRLTGLFVGLTLHTRPAEMYRALVEATAFGARIILEQFESFGVKVDRIIACGGIPYKSPMLMQIYADVLNRPIELARSRQTAALGSAIAAAVVAGTEKGGYAQFDSAMVAMTGTSDTLYKPNVANKGLYDRLYTIYRELHDSFGVEGKNPDLYGVMKQLLAIKDEEGSR